MSHFAHCQCHSLQQLWDFVLVIESCVSTWKKSPWKKLDVEEIEQHCKKFSKDIRMLNKMVRHWTPFKYIEQLLKNLVTSLRAITELQNTAIRDRHWLDLMKATGVNKCQINFSFEKKTERFTWHCAANCTSHKANLTFYLRVY